MTDIKKIQVNVNYIGTYGDSVDAIACSAGANCVQSVDRVTSSGEGIAILMVEDDQLDYLTDMMDEDDSIVSYKI